MCCLLMRLQIEYMFPTEDDLLAEQSAGEAASKVILHTEGGKQRQLIIIKRGWIKAPFIYCINRTQQMRD